MSMGSRARRRTRSRHGRQMLLGRVHRAGGRARPRERAAAEADRREDRNGQPDQSGAPKRDERFPPIPAGGAAGLILLEEISQQRFAPPRGNEVAQEPGRKGWNLPKSHAGSPLNVGRSPLRRRSVARVSRASLIPAGVGRK